MTAWRERLEGRQAQDVAQLDHALGRALAREDLVQALLDPRGHLFQRLEYVGDSVLDAVAVQSLVRLQPWDETSLAVVAEEQQALVSDHALGRVAVRRGLPPVRTFPASRHRLGDRIEASIGALWADAGIEAAAEAADRLVVTPGLDGLPRLDGLPEVETEAGRYLRASSSLGHEPVQEAWFRASAGGGAPRRRLAVVGDSVLEAATATAQYVEDPEATEALMSEERRVTTSNARLAARARELGLERRGDDRTDSRAMADEVQALVGAVTLDGGLRAGLLVAAAVLRRTFAPGPLDV